MSRYQRFQCEAYDCREEIILEPYQRLGYDGVRCPKCGMDMDMIDEFDFLLGDEEVYEGEIR